MKKSKDNKRGKANSIGDRKGCPHCGWDTSRLLFHVPRDIPELEEILHVPAGIVLDRLVSGEILVRKFDLPGLEGEVIHIQDAIKGLRDCIPTRH